MDVDRGRHTEAVDTIRKNLALPTEEGPGGAEGAERVIARISTTTELARAAQGADFLVEAAPEDLELKRAIFRELDALCPPPALLATNTSANSITEIASGAASRGRILGTHFWNPPWLVPLVEVVPGRDTAPWAMESACALLLEAGKRPVRVKKGVPGFVGNRLPHALWWEAVFIVEGGLGDAENWGEVVKTGFGMRLLVLGPLENADMVGLDLTLKIHAYLLEHLEDSREPSPLLREKVEKGELGFASGRGFRSWTPREMEECRANLLRHLVEWGTK
jgi:3-hydroxybutyryl-CoA dehydrogenase